MTLKVSLTFMWNFLKFYSSWRQLFQDSPPGLMFYSCSVLIYQYNLYVALYNMQYYAIYIFIIGKIIRTVILSLCIYCLKKWFIQLSLVTGHPCFISFKMWKLECLLKKPYILTCKFRRKKSFIVLCARHDGLRMETGAGGKGWMVGWVGKGFGLKYAWAKILPCENCWHHKWNTTSTQLAKFVTDNIIQEHMWNVMYFYKYV